MFVANDWQAALVPTYLVHKYRRNNVYTDSRCVFVIHNMGYQGVYPWEDGRVLGKLGLPHFAHSDAYFIYPHHLRCHELDKGEVINLTKSGVVCCDRVMTVSKNYAMEMQTNEGGFNLQDLIKGKSFYMTGVQNGIDDGWDPSTDEQIAAPYSFADLSGKAKCKAALQKRLGLEVRDDVAVLGFIGRLTWQKGVDIITSVLDWLLTPAGNDVNGNVQVIMMG